MAIIPDVPYVSVDIVVDGRALSEYLDEDDHESLSSNSTIKYVECVSGSKFGIQVDLNGMEPWNLEGGDIVLEDYFLDGKWVDGAVKSFPLNRHHAISVRHAARHREGGTWKERDFMFADLVTTEDAISKTLKPDLKDLGTITKRQKTQHNHQGVKFGHENLHEKHLKGQAMSYQAKLGEAVPIKDPAFVNARRFGEAFAVFTFRYRSRRDLQTMYLIPRSASPIPLEDRPEESLNREELLELLRRQKTRQDEQVAIKKELKRERTEDDDSDDDLMIISSRRPAKSFKSSTNVDTGIETIDLTGG
ncbi:hypothetical protein D6D28_01572 [Aureobasidium pullulans]|uniref:DUF7918 domain-containing protein n=1 Tax=Aureobasidium pullulans TaxID=5580 RepID=A0A4S8SWY9_AURPU|nr:hypothetical protein D6D28_01572 [Aureobasidium pullulans]